MTASKLLNTLLLIFFLILTPNALASSYKINYSLEYFNDYSPRTRVIQKVDVINLRSDTFVQEVTLFFPKPYLPQGMKVSGENNEVKTDIEQRDNGTNLVIHLPVTASGRNSHQQIILEYTQSPIVKKKGLLWEIFIPALTSDNSGEAVTTVHLPKEALGPLSISKPAPSLVSGQTITWRGTGNQSIYAVVGDRQKYRVTAEYHLKNDNLYQKQSTIALIPETAFQTVQIDKIDPKPQRVSLDQNNNYLAYYTLLPSEKKTIKLVEYVTVLAQPQDDVKIPPIKIKGGFWVFKKAPKMLPGFTNIEAIFNYVVDVLSYDYSRALKIAHRLGPDAALENPTQAICTEFTDLFITLARSEGFMTREVEGSAVSSDSHLQPLSLITDVLHAWPEYYDESRQLWIPVDPTWADTARLDYFHSFDLSHIVFAIHSDNPDSPPPAGMYKTEVSKDIKVELVDNIPASSAKPKITLNLPTRLIGNRGNTGSIMIKNTTPVFIKNASLKLVPTGLNVNPSTFSTALLPPQAELKFDFQYKQEGTSQQGTIKVLFNNQVVDTRSINIVSDGQSLSQIIIGIILGAIFIMFLVLTRTRKK